MFTRIRKRLALVPILAAAVVAVAAGPGLRAHADTSPIDITGLSIQIHAVVPDRDTGTPLETPVPATVLTPQAQQSLATPLSAQFDQFWSGTLDQDGKTARDRACDQATIQTRDTIQRKGKSAYAITCDFATTGKLQAQLVGSALYISYYLTNNTIEFRVTTPDTCNPDHTSYLCPNDPLFTVTFASEIWTIIHVPDVPCEMHAEDPATVETHDASIDSHNFSGDVAMALDSLTDAHEFSAAQRALEQTVRQQSLPLNGLLAAFSSSCSQARALGFRQFEAAIERDGIVFRLIHPAIEAPVLPSAAGMSDPNQPSFTRPLLVPSQPLVTAGNTLQLDGKYFNVNHATALHLSFQQASGWYCLGGGTELEWGPIGQARRQVVPAVAAGGCPGGFDATNLTAGTAYQFRARNCDQLTCSPWSTPTTLTTGAAGADTVTLTMDGDTNATPVGHCVNTHSRICLSPVGRVFSGTTTLGTATVTNQGTFSATVTLPAGITPGMHTLHAVLGDQQADAMVQVQAANATAAITIVSSLGTPLTSTVVDDSFTLVGTGFVPGTVTITLDSPAGFLVGTATAGTDGTFRAQLTVPYSQAGPHTLVAVESTDGGTTQATDAVTFVTPSVVR